MRLLNQILVITLLLACVACGANGNAQSGGVGNGAYGHVGVGVPF